MAPNVTTVMPPPPGYVVNFDHPTQHGQTTGYIVATVGLTLAVATLAMRTYTRFFITRNAAAEDYLIIFAFACGLCTQSIILHLWAVKIAGVHAWELPLTSFNINSMQTMIMSIMYVPCLGGAKLSILLLYKRLSPVRWFHYCIYTIMVIIAMYSVAIVFALIFPCMPIASNWDVTIVGGKCADKAKIYLATAGVNIATDILILVLPIPMVWNLQMARSQKIGLTGMFAVGSATCITSIIRLIYMIPMLTNVDATWAVSIPLIWVEVEANLVIIVCCMPAIRHFIRRFAPGFLRDPSNPTGAAYGPTYAKPNASKGLDSKYGLGSGTGGVEYTGTPSKSITHITSRAAQALRGNKSHGHRGALDSYDMMTRSDEDDIELTKHEHDEKDAMSSYEDVTAAHPDHAPSKAHAAEGNADDVERQQQIWTTKTFTVQ